MKTAVSIPDEVFESAERHASAEVTETLNRVCAGMPTPADDFVSLAARRTLERSEW
jgi:hypothetical protein